MRLTQRSGGPDSSDGHSRLLHRAWLLPAALGTVLGATYLLSEDPTIQLLCFVVAALLAVAATVTGLRLWRPGSFVAWGLIVAAQIFFLAGAMLRPWAVAQTGLAAASADLCTMTGYACCITGLITPLRSKGAQRFALADSAIVALGAGAVAVLLFAMPAAEYPGRPVWISLLAGMYPLIDVVLLLVVLQLGFTTAASTFSFRALLLSMTCLLVGDIGYAWIGAEGRLVGPRLLDLPFVAAYTLFGVSALHPSMTGLVSPAVRPVQAWSRARLALIVPALCAPWLAVLLTRDLSTLDRLIVASAACMTLAVLIWRSVTAVHLHVQAETVLKTQATSDRLTGLSSRVGVGAAVADRLATMQVGQSLWAVSLALDGFRMINDTWGHETGDRILVEVARRLSAGAPAPSRVGRIGGDEFIVLLEGTEERAVQVAETLRGRLAEPIQVDGLEFLVTASIGVASAPARGSAIDLLRDADTAMGRAKAQSRDRVVVFGDGMREAVRERLELEMALRQALDRDQFWVAYQPLMDMRTETVIGCEALLRWAHPQRGNIPPNLFIPIAEETGLIHEIGAWILGTAARQVSAWQRSGVVAQDFVVSVNLSPRQLTDPGVLGMVSSVVEHSDISTSSLVLEVTESVMLGSADDADDALAVLGRLRDMGIGLSLDDFGTGYSSLSYLSRLPVTTIKLDRSFVTPMEKPDGDDTIVKAVGAIAATMGLKVVAEGVETRTQHTALRELGVPIGQGWLWGPGVAAPDFSARWGTGQAAGGAAQAAGGAAQAAGGTAQATAGSGKSNAQ